MTYRASVLRVSSHRQTYVAFGRRDILTGLAVRDLRFSLKEILAAVFALFIFSLSLWSGYEIRSVSNDLAMLERESAQLDARFKTLKEAEERLMAPERLALAAQRLGLHKPEGSQIVRLED
ncbi:hypothetical protein [Dissulfurimicrobium hydrothermale]|uniref:hypothetical protein n=1 Tax=Dissulfurimicrobium hydrothermale TaxID=1750598 RepID=UPI001EDB892B|nr:hypothetical protein [Dissulfurimicrobium hydrothermale]UKL12882.1 hypothetical protein LGS26_05140 [Dissulfurimicrobium hydrothermale]